jgi:predicted RNA-binding Zn-ribbon protein involved in translation (DUF1610 family)
MKKGLYYTDHRLQYNYAIDDIPITKVSSYCCHNCNSSMNISIHACRIDDITCIQLWSCNNCGFIWKEIWSSYGQQLWSAK